MPKSRLPKGLLDVVYEEAAQDYLRYLRTERPEHFMESTAQSTQRSITVASLALVAKRRPEVQVFSELLVLYRLGDPPEMCRIVPDNMVVLHDQPIRAGTNYGIGVQPVGPFWVLEYVSKSNQRKDYEQSLERYERELKVPYYLIFYPETQDLTLFQLRRGRYRTVKPDADERVALPELELSMGLLDGWVRYWFRGELLPLPGELLDERDAIAKDRDAIAKDRDAIAKDRDAMAAENARLRALLGLPPA